MKNGAEIAKRGRRSGAEGVSGASRKKPANGEHQEQKTLFDFIRLHEGQHPELTLIYAIPNGGKRHVGVARKLKAEGVRAGVADIHVPIPRRGFYGMWVEMKYGKNKLTIDQRVFLAAMSNRGYCTAVCYSWIDAAKEIFEYLGLKRLLNGL